MSYTLEEYEQIKKHEAKQAKNREYQRKWIAKKRENDPEYYEKQKAYNAERKREKYSKDEDFKKKEKEYNKKYGEEKRKEEKKLNEKIKVEYITLNQLKQLLNEKKITFQDDDILNGLMEGRDGVCTTRNLRGEWGQDGDIPGFRNS